MVPRLAEAVQCHNRAAAIIQGYRIWPMLDLAKSSDHPAGFRFQATGSYGLALLRLCPAILSASDRVWSRSGHDRRQPLDMA